jgi:nitroimidazol reductase NimA-like FMN-containing flavoprotein (pyridoxamine 5'-phosphate oxidase superfamily)
VDDVATLHAILDAGRVAHVGVLDDDQPLVVPLAYARDGDRLLVHGSTGSRAMRWLATGAPTCVTVSLLDGYVLARAAVEVSMRYRSAMLMGSFTPVTGLEASTDALRRLSEHSVPGRWADLRPPTRKELAGTLVLALPIREWSVKINDGWPTDEPEDRSLPVWAGVVPVTANVGRPQPDPDGLVSGDPPAYLQQIPAPGLHA